VEPDPVRRTDLEPPPGEPYFLGSGHRDSGNAASAWAILSGCLGVDTALQANGASSIGNLLTPRLNLAVSAFTDGAKVGLATELRYREKVMATTWSSRQDARIPYTPPATADGRSASVTEIDLYHNLQDALGPV